MREIVLRTHGRMATKSDIHTISTHCTNLSLFEIHGVRIGSLRIETKYLHEFSSTTSIAYYQPFSVVFRAIEMLSVPGLAEQYLNLDHLFVENHCDDGVLDA